MPNNYSPDTQVIWDMHLKGVRNMDICAKTGFNMPKVASAISRGRDLGVLPPVKFIPASEFLIKNGTIRRGNVSDVLNRLGETERDWVVQTAANEGYESISEYLLDLVLDEYERTRQ